MTLFILFNNSKEQIESNYLQLSITIIISILIYIQKMGIAEV